MPFKFNPFTGSFDQTGSGGGGGASYIDGEVATYNDLPLDGTAALNSAWLVRSASGVWPVSRKQAGIYIRTATAGSSRDADYTYAGTMPDVFSDAVFTLYDEASTTRTGQFNLGNITAGQNRVLTWPDGDGTIARTEDFAAPPAIGSTTRNTIAATTLNATNGTITASAPVLDLEQTWNNAAVAFTGMRLNCVQTANSTSSSYFTISRTGTPVFQIVAQSPNIPLIEMGAGGFITRIRGRTSSGVGLNFDGVVGVNTSLQFGVGATTGAGDVILARDSAANTLAQVNGTNAQTFRLYNTSANSNADFERGFMRWSSNVLQIGTEAGGTGSARNLELQTGGTTRFTIATTGASILGPNSLGAIFGATGGGNITCYGSALGNQPILLRTLGGSYRFGLDAGPSTSSGFVLVAEANDVMALRDGTDAQTFRIYNTTDAGLTNFERGFMRWSSNVLQIGTEAGGTGSNRIVEVFIGGQSVHARFSAAGSGVQLSLRNIDTSSTSSFAGFTLTGNITVSGARDIILPTVTGTKIGTATNQLLGFYGVTPVDQPATVADPTGGGTVDAEARTAINDIIDRLQELGLIA